MSLKNVLIISMLRYEKGRWGVVGQDQAHALLLAQSLRSEPSNLFYSNQCMGNILLVFLYTKGTSLS